jgi:hypothetical protein
MVYTLSFFLQNAVCVIILKYLVPVLFTFYIQGVLKLKKNSGAKRLKVLLVEIHEFIKNRIRFLKTLNTKRSVNITQNTVRQHN